MNSIWNESMNVCVLVLMLVRINVIIWFVAFTLYLYFILSNWSIFFWIKMIDVILISIADI